MTDQSYLHIYISDAMEPWAIAFVVLLSVGLILNVANMILSWRVRVSWITRQITREEEGGNE